jgi:hypothetical protein
MTTLIKLTSYSDYWTQTKKLSLVTLTSISREKEGKRKGEKEKRKIHMRQLKKNCP